VFCPKCKSEYRMGFTVCTDCDVPLVEELPPESKLEPEYIEFEEILGTYNPADVAIIKSILDGDSITYYLLGENFMYVRPLADPVRLMVKKEQAQRARELLAKLKLSFSAISPREPEE